MLTSRGEITPQTMLQNAPFRGLNKREAVNPVDHSNRFVVDSNLFHQGSYHLSFCQPVCLLKTAVYHGGKCLDLTNHETKILQTILFCRQCGDLIVQALQTFLCTMKPRFKLSAINQAILVSIDQTANTPFDLLGQSFQLVQATVLSGLCQASFIFLANSLRLLE